MSLSPMMQHYQTLKSEHPGSLLFYRLGDFYELFFDDALKISQALHLTLTKRGTFEGQPIPMAGLPHHCADQYIARLLKLGFSIAVCEQITDARLGPVERAVTRIITPGTLTDESYLDADQASLLASLIWNTSLKQPSGAIAIVELSSGRFTVFESEHLELLIDECDRMGVKELLIHENSPKELIDRLTGYPWLLQKRPHWEFHAETNTRILMEHFSTHSLDGFGFSKASEGTTASGLVLAYLKITQKSALSHIHSLRIESLENCVLMDSATRRHLELVESQSKEKKHTLLQLFAPSYTAMGLRLISHWMLKPSSVLSTIRKRQEALLWLNKHKDNAESLAQILSSIADVERITSRLAMHSAKPVDLLALSHALGSIPALIQLLPSDGLLSLIATELAPLEEVKTHIDNVLIQPAPSHMRDGGYIRPESDERLHEYWMLKYDSDGVLRALEEREKQATGLNLSIQSNRVHGLYIVLPRSLSEQAPAHYKRKQTLKNEERFSIPELLELESKINNAHQAMLLREKECYQALLFALQPSLLVLKKNARLLALLDALLTMARLGTRSGYSLPRFQDEPGIEIHNGRHPVLESILEHVVPNDTKLEPEHRLMILTGPNMGGKSTYMRQVATLTLLAYMGSYVPADAMQIGPIDRIMTRIGARDEISQGRSTFMMEMIETAYILNHATPTSLVLLDEIGRGTSTRDGLAIAKAVCRSLLDYNRSMTIFATHYFELTAMSEHPGVLNRHVAVHEGHGVIAFLHKIVSGCTDQSYGLHVAKLAGIANPVLDLAYSYAQDETTLMVPSTTRLEKPSADATLLKSIMSILLKLNPEEMSPMAAHHMISRLIDMVKSDS